MTKKEALKKIMKELLRPFRGREKLYKYLLAFRDKYNYVPPNYLADFRAMEKAKIIVPIEDDKFTMKRLRQTAKVIYRNRKTREAII